MLNRLIKFFLDNRPVALLLLAAVVVWGVSVAPFDWHGGLLPSDPVAVDAIPDIGENQQIVAAEWMGRSPKDVQEQVTYPLTTSLLGISGVKTIRSTSMFGMSFIYVIFEDGVEFYWSRSRILEKLNSLPAGTLPQGVQPALGPDATALGQVFWYTLEGRDPKTGKPTGGWGPDELRTIQDFYVRYSLLSAEGVSEAASIGGFVKEYQVEINPNALRAYGVSVMDVMDAVQKSNLDVGAETIELNRVEYLVRGLGQIKSVADLEETVVAVRGGVPVRVRDVAVVNFGPAARRGGLDKEGVEAAGGVVVARYGSNPMAVIENVKAKIEELSAGLPQKTLADGTVSKVTVVPFYDRSGLIRETVGTLETALTHEILICVIVVIALVFNLKASFVISGLLPVAVLSAFVIMKYTGVDANIVALSGIAIAIGVMVDVGVVIIESVLRKMREEGQAAARRGKEFAALIYSAVKEISSALSVGMLTTVISFLPVFAMQAQEGKLFKPLAYTKTFALLSAFVLGFALLPTIAYYVLSLNIASKTYRRAADAALIAGGVILLILTGVVPALALTLLGISNITARYWKNPKTPVFVNTGIALLAAVWYLASEWLPVGTEAGFPLNFALVVFAVGAILAVLWALVVFYERILRWCLANRLKFMLIPALTLAFGAWIWRGMGEEFMPSLNEGSFLLMPTSMPHTGIEENLRLIETVDRRVSAIPEIETGIGKWGRANSALDPAPVQMFENTVNYRPEYVLDENGRRARFKTDSKGRFLLKDGSAYSPSDGFRLIPPDSLIIDRRGGKYLRQWRPHIKNADDIWQEIVNASHVPGLTSAPKLQPIEARLVMLSTGMRAPMGLKISGPGAESIERAGKAFEAALKEVPSVLPSTVFYDRAAGAPYIEIRLNRRNMARYGITVAGLQEVIGAAAGGMALTSTIEGRERFPVRVRYPRELRDSPEALSRILIPTAAGAQIPLGDVADIEYVKGAQMIQSENTFLTGYVIFDKQAGKAEVDVVREAGRMLKSKIESGAITLPDGVSYRFAGNYEQQRRAAQRLLIVIPLCLLSILIVLYFQFRSVTASLIHFSGVFVAFAGGFIMLWLYGQPWFMDFSIGGENLRDIFQIRPVNLSIAVWVGFIALFGIATDDGVLMGTYIHDTFAERSPQTPGEIREAVVHAGLKRVRPAAMTTATTLIALLPVLTSTGKGADIMIPMAIPTFGGMLIQSMTMFIVPVLQCLWRERAAKKRGGNGNLKYALMFALAALIIPAASFGQDSVHTADDVHGLPDSLEHYLRIAEEGNPSVRAAYSLYQAGLQKAPQAGALPDPQVEAGVFVQPMELADGRQIAQFQVMQMFPWFGARKAARAEARSMADMAYQEYRQTRDRLRLEVYTQWYALARLRQRLDNGRKNRLLLTRLEELALRRFSSSAVGVSNSGGAMPAANSGAPTASAGTGMGGMAGMGGASGAPPQTQGNMPMGAQDGASLGMSDVLRVRLEMAETDNAIENVLSEIEVEKAKFNALLNRPPASEVHVPDTLEQIPFTFDADSVMARIKRQNPMLAMLAAEDSAFGAKADMDRRMGYPMFGVGLQYMIIGKKPGAMDMGGMNGRDMVMPMASATIPVYRGKYRARQSENAHLRQASRERYADALNALEAELRRAKNDLDNAARQIALYRKQSELAQTAYNLTVQEFVSGRGGLGGVIQAQRLLLDYELKTAEAAAAYNVSAANIQNLVSLDK